MVNHKQKSTLLLIAILVVLGVAMYSNTFRVEFTFDDIRVITENPAVKHLNKPLELWKYWSTRWLLLLTFAVNYRLHALNVVGYHIVNLAIHVLSGVVLFFLVQRLFSAKALAHARLRGYAPASAFFAALLFLLHPLQTQAVTYIVQRGTSLATLLYLVALLLYVASRQSRERRRAFLFYTLCIATIIAAMFTKEIAITIPLCILLYAIILEGESLGEIMKRWKHYAPLLLTLIVIPATLYLSHARSIAEFSDPQRATLRLPLPDYLLTEINVVRTYLRLLFVPVGQNLDWDYPVARSILEARTLASLLLLLGIVAGTLRVRKRNPLVCFGIVWFFLALSVESSLLPLYNVIAEHRLYLPMAGFCIAFVAGLYDIAGAKGTRAATVALCVCVVVLGGWTYQRNRVWQEGRIWEDTVQKSPRSARAHNNLGNWHKSKGRTEDAMREYTRAVEVDPNYYNAYNNLGSVYDSLGRVEEAIRCYARVLTINPTNAEAYNNLGIAFGKRGLLDRAIEIFRKGLEFAPDDANLHSNLGFAYLKKGDAQSAVAELEKAVQINPDNENARQNLRHAQAMLRNALKQ